MREMRETNMMWQTKTWGALFFGKRRVGDDGESAAAHVFTKIIMGEQLNDRVYRAGPGIVFAPHRLTCNSSRLELTIGRWKGLGSYTDAMHGVVPVWEGEEQI